MNKEKEEMLERLRNVKQTAEEDLLQYKDDEKKVENEFVQDVKYYGNIELTRKDNGEKVSFEVYTVEIYDYNKDEIKTKIYLDGQEVNLLELMQEYEEDITDTLSNKLTGKKQEDLNKDKEISDEGKKEKEKIYSLNELEKEKQQEEKGETKNKDKKKEETTPKKKRKPSYVIETVNPDKAKMDYWQTVKQACGLPPKVETLAFAYPVSSEDKVDYANITVYMLDKDGYIMNDLDIDDYFEFDSSTGNNPVKDNVKRHEEDENKGKTQLDSHNTMIRLFAKNSKDRNTYISLEQKNSFGDYNDINAGRKAIAGTQNVEKQLETDRVRVWDSERELLMRSNAGMYHINDMLKETEIHEKHGDKSYTHMENADGYSYTKVPCGKNIYVLIECLIKLKENNYIGENRSDREIMKVLTNIIDKNPDITKEQLINKVESDIIGNNEKYGHNNENKEKEDLGRFREGPWDKQ